MLTKASGYFFLGAGCEKITDYCLSLDSPGLIIGADNEVV